MRWRRMKRDRKVKSDRFRKSESDSDTRLDRRAKASKGTESVGFTYVQARLTADCSSSENHRVRAIEVQSDAVTSDRMQ